MRCFYDPGQLAHAPAMELHNGAFVPYAEKPERAAAIAATLGATEVPEDRGEGPIRAVHDAAYIDFLKTAPARWAEAGRPGDVMGYIWPAVRKRALKLERIDALAGQYSIDASTPLAAQTWDASYRSVQCALAATHAVLDGERAAFAMSRSPRRRRAMRA